MVCGWFFAALYEAMAHFLRLKLWCIWVIWAVPVGRAGIDSCWAVPPLCARRSGLRATLGDGLRHGGAYFRSTGGSTSGPVTSGQRAGDCALGLLYQPAVLAFLLGGNRCCWGKRLSRLQLAAIGLAAVRLRFLTPRFGPFPLGWPFSLTAGLSAVTHWRKKAAAHRAQPRLSCLRC